MAIFTRRRPRKRSQGGEAAVTELKAKVDTLIKENRRLKREITKVEQKGGASVRFSTCSSAAQQKGASRSHRTLNG